MFNGLKVSVLLLLTTQIVRAQDKLSLDNDLVCVSLSIYHEARGEITAAEFAVAQLIMKRVEDNRFPSDPCGVVKYKGYSKKHNKWVCAFEWYCEFKGYVDIRNPFEKRAWHQALKIANMYLSDNPPVLSGFEEALLFHDDSIDDPWSSQSSNVKKIGVIDNLVFYSE